MCSPGIVLIFVNIALYAFCFQMQTPVQPKLLRELGVDESALGQMQAVFGVFQTLGTLLSGTLMDMYGTRGLLVLNFVSSAVCYGMYYVAPDAWWLYAAQVPTLLQHGMLASRTYLSVHANSDQQRETLLGMTRFAYGAGMMVGPALGGWLADSVDLRAPAGLAAVGSLVSCASVVLLDDGTPPGSATRTEAAPSADAKPPLSVASVLGQMRSAAAKAWAVPALRGVLFIRFVGMLAASLAYRALPIVAKSQFGMEATGLGAFMSFSAAVGAATQVAVVGGLPAMRSAARRAKAEGKPAPFWALSDTSVVLTGLVIVFGGFLLLGAATETAQLYVAVAVMVLGPVLVDVILSGRIASLATDKGFANSVDMAGGSVLRSIAAPYLSAWLVSTFGFASVGHSAAVLVAVAVAAVLSGAVALESPEPAERPKED
ncbi:hypothetical protein FNF28_04928 [Cafeteria roenbergensis]|uniref:Major facilitator superfamily (MFS) profile domain-containing protein n=2 Tax=Cafeteria roenbergensis TaxID=33653 RepID=A0A5A8D8N9_CAFRO|nr:hypothetical protein FNF28_04928 [Cafeteria roenbergensis]